MLNMTDALRLPETQAAHFIPQFNIEDLRITQDFDDAPVERKLTSVPFGKFHKASFFRVHPDATFQCWLLDLKETNETFLVTQEISQVIPGLARPVRLYLAADREGNLRLIPLPLPGTNGQTNQWHASLQLCLQLAMQQWIRMQANMTAGSYDAFEAKLQAQPKWPTESMSELINIAARDKIISTADHPVIRRLLGEDLV